MTTDRIIGARLDHIAIGARRLSDAVDLLVGRLGGTPHAGGPGIEFRGCQWEFEGGGRIEVIEPEAAPGGFLHRFLDARGPGLHHVTFKVPSIHRAAELARAHGYTVVGFNDAFEGWKEMFLHPREAQGIVIQLAETDPSVADSWGPDFPFPRALAPAAARARVVGLRLAALSFERARKQWEGLLGARSAVHGASLVFSWPDSPLEISVYVERNEGPLSIEVDASSAVSELEDRALGVRVSRRGA